MLTKYGRSSNSTLITGTVERKDYFANEILEAIAFDPGTIEGKDNSDNKKYLKPLYSGLISDNIKGC